MQNSNKLRNLFIFLSLVILLLVGGFGIIDYQNNDDNLSIETEDAQEQEAALEVIDREGNLKSYTLKFTEGETAFEAMQDLKHQDQSFTFDYENFEGLGAFVSSINGITADPNSEFISFQVNGQDSMEGISSYILKKGDKLSFKVVKFN